MLKVFLTGDIHVGLAYNRYPEAKAKLVDGRFEALRRSARLAEEEGCDFFAVAGDLFDTISNEVMLVAAMANGINAAEYKLRR